jgi:hypothetical protein
MPNNNSSKMKTKFLFFICCGFLLTSCAHQETNLQIENKERLPSSALSRVATELLMRPVRYDSCRGVNSYLEPSLARMPQDYRVINSESQNRLPIQCLQLAQRSFVGHYGLCNTEDEKPEISSVRPCLSESYTYVAYNAYHDVMDCFNLDPRSMFYQIMIESGFHINAINKNGFDSGMAQFTANGIKHVAANNLIERTRRILLESSRASCQRISSIVGSFSIDAFTVQKRCSMIAMPRNPYRAMLFSYLHTLVDQIKLNELLSDVPELDGALNDRIRRQFLFLSYNRGMTGLMRLLRGYINTRTELAHEITEDDLDLSQNLSKVKAILRLEPVKRDILKQSKIRNLTFAEYAVINNATYLSDMSAARDYVERYYGDSCGEF